MINTNWHPISYHFEVIADYCWNFWTLCVFESPFGGLGATYDVHRKLIGKHANPISVNWTFLLGVTAETLRAKIDRKSAFCNGVGELQPNFHLQGDIPHKSFLCGWIGRCQWIPYNFVAAGFHTKTLCSRLFQAQCNFTRKTAVLRFEPSPKGGGAYG